MLVKEVLRHENNNIDLLRILLASLVVFGHADALNGPSKYWIDPVAFLFPFTYSGALAVKVFFFISGMVVTNSLLKTRSPVKFITSRFFRIWPSILFLLVVTAFVIGPMVTEIPISSYFGSLDVYKYVPRGLFFQFGPLPSLFTASRYPSVINGSLWTLPLEVNCYLLLLGLFLILNTQRRAVINVVLLLILVESLWPTKFLFNLGAEPEVNLLPVSFAFGAFLAVNAEKIQITLMPVVGLWIVYFFSRNCSFVQVALILATCATLLLISTSSWFVRLKPRYDISFGIYLWGWVCQQVVYHFMGHIYAGFHTLLAWSMAVGFAFVSHFLVERHGIAIGRQICAWIDRVSEKGLDK